MCALQKHRKYRKVVKNVLKTMEKTPFWGVELRKTWVFTPPFLS